MFYTPDYPHGIISVAARQQRSFAYTYANWKEVPKLPPELEHKDPSYPSRRGSLYWYTNSGVYRKSDHWGYGIGTCDWLLDGQSYDGIISKIGYCRWDDFVDLERTSMRKRAYEDNWLDEWLDKRKRLFQFYELEAYLGDYIDDYDIDAIINEATEVDYNDGKLYWIEDVDLADIVDRHMLRRANRHRPIWEDRDLERTNMRRRVSNRRMTAAKVRIAWRKIAGNIAWEIAENAASIIKDNVEGGYVDADYPEDTLSEAVYSALDDNTIYYHQMWQVIEDYGDIQAIWEFVMSDGSAYEELMDDVYTNLNSLIPSGFNSWDEYIKSNVDDDERDARRRRAMRNPNRRMRRRAGITKRASSAYDIASRAADMIMYDGWEDTSDALYTAIDDELISTSDMMDIIQEYGDTSDIWRAFAESSGFDDFMDACWSEFADLVPDGYDDWEDYINNNFDEGDVMDALAEVGNDELAEMEDYDERWDYLMDIAIDATGKDIDTMSGSYDAISDLVNGRLKELGFTASRRKMMYRKPRIYAHRPIRRACRYRR